MDWIQALPGWGIVVFVVAALLILLAFIVRALRGRWTEREVTFKSPFVNVLTKPADGDEPGDSDRKRMIADATDGGGTRARMSAKRGGDFRMRATSDGVGSKVDADMRIED
jgi:hypothetical protein